MPSTINAIGTKHVGKANCVTDEGNQEEDFDTTLWFVFLLLPIFPIKSYRIRQKQWFLRKELSSDGVSLTHRHAFHIIKKYSLNWKQILKTYILVYGGIVIFVALITHLIKLVE